MKRSLPAFLSLLVTVAVVLGLFVIHYRDRLFKEEHPCYHTLYEDLPAIEASDASCLLDPTFIITDENLSDCIDKYFSAPAMLFFHNPYADDYVKVIKDPAKTVAFSEVFHDVPLTQLTEEEFRRDHDFLANNSEYIDEYYEFVNAVGTLHLYGYENETYILFSREAFSHGDTLGELLPYDRTYFRAEAKLVSELIAIAKSLEAHAEEHPIDRPH